MRLAVAVDTFMYSLERMSLCGMPVVMRNYNFSRSDKLDMDANDAMFSAVCHLLSKYIAENKKLRYQLY